MRPAFTRLLCGAVVTALGIQAPATGQATYTVLHQIAASTNLSPECTLLEVSPGEFMGTLVLDGTIQTRIFRVTSTGQFAILASMNKNQDGAWTEGALVQANNGAVYGSTMGYGPNGLGTVFRTNTRGAVSVVNSQISIPSPLVEGSDGYLYGTGFQTSSTYGLFRLSLGGTLASFFVFPGTFSYTTLVPTGPVLQASDGNFYGELFSGGSTIFQITPQGTYKALYQTSDLLVGGLLEAPNGLLYGAEQGAAFSISKTGVYTMLHTFQNEGAPQSGLTLASDGFLYGGTAWNISGVGNGPAGIYRVGLDGSNYSLVYSFGDAYAGVYTLGPSVVQGSDGKLYGAQINGTNSQIFSLDLGLPKPQPVLTGFTPKAGAPGTVVQIAGSQLLGAIGVSFNGTPAPAFVNRGGSYVQATVPPGATSGKITMTTPNGETSTPQNFTVK
jgi:hypothetical protein